MIDPAVAGCAITDGTLACAFDSLAAGESITIVVKAPSAVDDCDDLVNTVAVGAGNEAAADAGNNSDTATIVVECSGVEITKFLCVTSKQHDVAFLVIEPDGTITGDDHHDPNKCTAVNDVAFTIEGDTLDAPITVTTGADGKVSVDLPPGDYTITEDATGASAAFRVLADGTTLIKVFNFEVKETPTPTPTPTPQLPDTGSGSGPVRDLDGATWLLLFAAVVVIGGVAYALRRQAA